METRNEALEIMKDSTGLLIAIAIVIILGISYWELLNMMLESL